jgi:hypothetical protein
METPNPISRSKHGFERSVGIAGLAVSFRERGNSGSADTDPQDEATSRAANGSPGSPEDSRNPICLTSDRGCRAERGRESQLIGFASMTHRSQGGFVQVDSVPTDAG